MWRRALASRWKRSSASAKTAKYRKAPVRPHSSLLDAPWANADRATSASNSSHQRMTGRRSSDEAAWRPRCHSHTPATAATAILSPDTVFSTSPKPTSMVTRGSATTSATTASVGRIVASTTKPTAYSTSAATAIERDRLTTAIHSPAQVAARAASASLTSRLFLVSRGWGTESPTETGPLSDDTSESAHAASARSLTPVREQIPQRLLEWDARLPSECVQPAAITDQHRHVRGPEARGVFADRDGRVDGFAEEKIENLLDRPPATRAEVVDLPGFAPIEEQ